ncbi:MAG: BatD family protein [Planctomycetes bacterium]|nr:BatD family protein [Planctomycetota bacterium]MCB9916789.1 BatD family protein [Planctomycetota bacterium]
MRVTLWILTTIVALAASTPASAQSAMSLSLSGPDAEVIQLGRTATVRLDAENGEGATLLELPKIPNVRVRASSPNDSSSQQFVNGRLLVDRTVRSWTIEFEPVEAGTYRVPPLRVRDTTGRVHETRAITFTCEAGRASSAFIEASFDPERPYVGESVTMRVRFGVDPQHVGLLIRQSRYEQARDFTVDFPPWDEMPAGAVPSDALESLPNAQIVPVNRRYRILQDLGVQKRGDSSFHVFEITKTMRPERVGVFELDRATLRYSWASRFGRNVFGERVATQTSDEFARSEPVRLEVRALPSEGRPAEFAGAVGTLTLEATLDKREVRVGESFPFVLRLTGTAVHDGMAAPDLTKLDGFEGFHVFGKKVDFEGRTLVARYDLSALQPGDAVLPEIRVPHFDTASGRYDVARVGPFRLTVTGSVAKELEALPESKKALTAGVDDLWDRMDVRGDAPERFRPSALLAWIALALPFALFGLGFVTTRFVRRARNDVAGRRRRGARRVFEERLAQQGPLVALTGFIADRLGIEAGAVVGQDLEARLVRHGLSEAHAREVVGLVQRLEALRYAGTDATAEAALAQDASSVADRLEKELRA